MTSGPFLLDTHVIIWIFEDSSQLSRNALAAIKPSLSAAHRGALVVSVASFWEVITKSRKKSMGIADPVTWWDRAVSSLDATVLSIRPSHVVALAGLADHHQDPFDRILVAQTIAEGYTLITKDPQMKRYTTRTLW